MDGFMTECGQAMFMISMGMADFCPNNNCGPRVLTNGVREILAPLTRNPDSGELGYYATRWTQTAVTVNGETEYGPLRSHRQFVPARGDRPFHPDRWLRSIVGCEGLLASIFTDDPNSIFVDVTDGDGYDPVIESERTPKDAADDEHNHIYNPESESKRNTNIFAPAGGVVLGSGVHDRQNWMSVYYRNLGGVENVVLQIWHVENYNGRGGVPQNGRIQLGQMGANGNIRYGPFGSPEGWHVHINAYKWWGGINRKGVPIGNALGARTVKAQNRLRLSDLFCK